MTGLIIYIAILHTVCTLGVFFLGYIFWVHENSINGFRTIFEKYVKAQKPELDKGQYNEREILYDRHNISIKRNK